MGQTRFNFFYLGINSRGIFQVNFDLWPFYCSVPVAVKSNQIFWIFFTNFLFLQHCPVMGKHILTILMNCKNKMNIIPSTTRIDWCAFVLHEMLKKNKMLFIKFHIIMKKVFLLVQKNLNQSNHIFVVERKTFCHICKWPIRSGFASAGNSFWPIRFGFMSVFVVKPCDTPYYCYCEQQYYWFCQMVVMTLYCTCYQQ